MKNIILLHGALGSKSDLAGLSVSLKNKGLNTFEVEFSGHGESTFRSDFDIPQFTKELEEFIQSQSIRDASIFGYSMGGYVALNLARQKRALIQKIITLGTKFDWTKDATEIETSKLNPDAIKEKIPKFAAALQAKHVHGWERLLRETTGLMNDISLNNYLDETALASIINPVLVGLGDKDKMVTYEETKNVFKTLPDSGMYVLPNTQHPLETADTGLLAEIISGFLKD